MVVLGDHYFMRQIERKYCMLGKYETIAASCAAVALGVLILVELSPNFVSGQKSTSSTENDSDWQASTEMRSSELTAAVANGVELITPSSSPSSQETSYAGYLEQVLLNIDYVAAAENYYEEEWEEFVSQLNIAEADKQAVKDLIVMHKAHNRELLGQWIDGRISSESYDANRLNQTNLEQALDDYLSVEDLNRFRTKLEWMHLEFEEKRIAQEYADIVNQYTDILYYSRINDFPTVQAYIASGADVNAMPVDGSATPLHNASRHGNLDMVEALISAGANVNAVTTGVYKKSALHDAAFSGDVEVIRALVEAGAEIDYADPDSVSHTALRSAVMGGNAAAVSELLDLGADATGEAGKYALLNAIAMDWLDIEAMLIDAGADGNDMFVVSARKAKQKQGIAK